MKKITVSLLQNIFLAFWGSYRLKNITLALRSPEGLKIYHLKSRSELQWISTSHSQLRVEIVSLQIFISIQPQDQILLNIGSGRPKPFCAFTANSDQQLYSSLNLRKISNNNAVLGVYFMFYDPAGKSHF